MRQTLCGLFTKNFLLSQQPNKNDWTSNCVMCNLFKTTPQWSKPSWERFFNLFYANWLPIFPYVTGVKLKYCSQGIPTTGFYLNHAFMLWHTLKWSVIKLTSIHQKILSSFDYSICVVNSNVTILRPILYTYFFFRELPHIYIYI